MITAPTKIPVSCLWRLFLPALLIISFVLVIVSFTATNFHEFIIPTSKTRASSLVGRHVHQSFSQNKETMFLKDANLTALSIPESVEEKSQHVEVTSKRVNVMNVDVFYREAHAPPGVEPSHQSVLFLHGANFKSQTWLDLNTIHLLAALGHHVVAIDLPGYGETSSILPGKEEIFLKEFIDTLKLQNFVIVSPSMSGGFSIPYLIKYSKTMDGYVPIAPVSTNKIVHEGPNITTPTMILYGELDRGLGFTSLNHLSHLPNSQAFVLPNAKHPAYLDQPLLFHQLLYNFLKLINNQKQS